jgi:hypothetical protein
MARAREKSSQRKISKTFLEFAEPLWIPLGAEATDQELEQVLMIAFTVWNTVVFDALDPSRQGVKQLRNLAGEDPSIRAIIEQLITRKQSLFANDQRLIGEYRLNRRQGELRLWAEARQPQPPR